MWNLHGFPWYGFARGERPLSEVRRSFPAWRTVLPQASRGEREGDTTAAQRAGDGGAAPFERAVVRERLPPAREDQTEAVPGLRQQALRDAPPRLHEAAGDRVALRGLSTRVAEEKCREISAAGGRRFVQVQKLPVGLTGDRGGISSRPDSGAARMTQGARRAFGGARAQASIDIAGGFCSRR